MSATIEELWNAQSATIRHNIEQILAASRYRFKFSIDSPTAGLAKRTLYLDREAA